VDVVDRPLWSGPIACFNPLAPEPKCQIR
jgi:hypothetical protein